jgi:hypothetical protein
MNDSMARVARRLVAVLLVGLSLAVSKAIIEQFGRALSVAKLGRRRRTSLQSIFDDLGKNRVVRRIRNLRQF